MNRRRFLGTIPVAAALGAGVAYMGRWPLARAATPAKFVATYTGNPPADVQAAFQYALDQWSKVLSSPADIHVAMDWSPGGSPSTVHISSVTGVPGGFSKDTVYPVALANRLVGKRVNGDNPDMTILFNSTISPTGVPDVFSWYLGTDGKPSAVQYDLVTHAMVQVAHGLGISSTVRVSGSKGTFGTSNKPVIMDQFLVDKSGDPIASYTTNSVELGTALYAGYSFFGPHTILAAGGPALFSIYSSALDLAAFPPCTTDSLIVTFLGLPGIARPKPGAIERAMLDDMGWSGLAAAQRAGDEDAGPLVFGSYDVELPEAPHCDCTANGVLVPVELQPAANPAQVTEQTGTVITVNFSNDFPEAAKTAVRKAADMWQTILSTPVEIIVTATWDLTGAGLLGRCTPTEVADFPNAPFPHVRYQTALANRFAGTRVASGHDMQVAFTPGDETFWYFGTDGKPGAYQYELLSTAMHEMGHGLGHIGTPLALQDGNMPRVWDLFFGGHVDQRLLDYTLGSAALIQEVGTAANFRGPQAIEANNDEPVKLHASGHRFSTAYCSAETPPLMAASGFPGQAVRPDAVMLASLRDIGWGDAPSRPIFRKVVATELAHS